EALAVRGERVLEPLEARAAVRLHDDDLAVEPGAVDRQTLGRARDARERVGPVLAAAREESRLPALDPAERAVAVVLELGRPLGPRRRGARERRELRDQMRRQLRVWRIGDRRLPRDALGTLVEDVALGERPRDGVALLQEEPVLAALARSAAHARERP